MNSIRLPVLSVLLLCPFILWGELEVAEIKRDKPVDFQEEILPMLRANCLACHNRTRSKGEVIMETPDDIRKGNEGGPFVEAGNAEESFLFQLAAHTDEPIMPPAKNKVGAKNLTPTELGLLKLWIDQGAKGTLKASLPVTWQAYQRELPPIYATAVNRSGRFAVAGRGNRIHLYDLGAGEKEPVNLSETEIPKAKEIRKQAEESAKVAKAKKAEKGLSPEQLAATEDSLKMALEKVTQATAFLGSLEKEAKDVAGSLKSSFSATELKKRQQALAVAQTDLEKNSFAWQKAKAKLANQSKILDRAKKKSGELAQRMKKPSFEPLVLETVLGGALNLPVSLEAKDKSFATPTKVRIMGTVAAAKIKEITIDPKKKKDGDLAINLTQAKFPAGEFNLICLARGKGKYRLYDELEKNATEQQAKEVADSLAALKKQTDEAKKKLDADKKGLAAKEAELKKAEAALGVAEKESAKLAGELKAAESKLAKARDTLKKQEAGGTPESAKLDALKKTVSEAEKSVASLKEKSQTMIRDKLQPAKGKKEEWTNDLEALQDRIALAETGHSGLAEKLKLMEDKKKKSDARLKVVKDAFAKPMDLNFAHFDLPFVLRVKKAPFVFEDLPTLELKPGEPAVLPVRIDREHDFEDPVTLRLILPKEAEGISLKSQNIDKSESLGEIKYTPQTQASVGKHSCTLEASFRYKNQNLKLSQSIELTVLPAPKKNS